MKQKFKQECECGKVIIGFSEHHLSKNMQVHKSISNEHKLRISLLKKARKNQRINIKNLSNDLIVELMSNNPLIIYDIKEIGRSLNKEERDIEKKKIMVS